MTTQYFRNFNLTFSLTSKFTKADVTAEPSSTLIYVRKFFHSSLNQITKADMCLHQKQLSFLKLKVLTMLMLHQAQQQGRKSLAY